ncbi:MAG: hypothetical protein JWR36_1946 [Glaciihabitans sp.]|nr:hypothetical protein [Glaciihabitans sp.]MDQ1571418.1 hypothetical protein [Actinomycetota bacterium]
MTLVTARRTDALGRAAKAEYDQRIEFTTKRSAIEVAEAFRVGMDLPVGVDSPIFGQLYIASISTAAIEFISSSNRGKAFASRLEISTSKRSGSTGAYFVVEVNDRIATVADLHQLHVVERRVRAVLESLAATITETA